MSQQEQEDAASPRTTNPFTPVFGKVPAYLAGREQIIYEMIEAFDSDGNDPNLCSIFVGARGTGKTSLLTYLGTEAAQLGWIVADVTAAEGMLEDILQRIQESGAHLLEQASPRRLTGIEIATLGSLSWDNADDQELNWRSRMNVIFDQLGPTGTGILITVDEIDPSLPEMEQLVMAYQHFVREGKRVSLIMAGLPHRVSSLLSGKSTSFLRRAARHDLGSIPDYEVEEAFRLTVENGGRTIDQDALDMAVDAIGGFPFMFQLVGYRSWNTTRRRKTISLEDVRTGSRLAREELWTRVYDATYAELSKGDIAFLRAMAQDEGKTERSDLTRRLGKSSSHVSTYKKRLLEAGVIEEPHQGEFVFALPGFREFLLSKDE